MNITRLFDFFEINRSDREFRYFAQFELDEATGSKRADEYRNGTSQDLCYQAELLLRVGATEHRAKAFLMVPKVRKNATGVLVARWVIAVLLCSSSLQWQKDIAIEILSKKQTDSMPPEFAEVWSAWRDKT